jgi:ribosomal peptide maturation radical SAM protein 1
VRQVLAGEVANAPGVRTKRTVHENFEQAAASTSTPVPHMDDLPYPDYADFFEQFGKTRFAKIWQPGLFYETSRGCWWGEKQHCTFCGLNGATMAFRSKSAGRALQELLSLVEAHPGCDIQVVDNILDMKYFDDFVPELARRKLDLVLFYETKSNLRKEQIRLLAAANIRQLQPGVESLSDAVLKLMRKGVSGLQNIQLLKWCKEHGVTPHWNYLFGFPGEPAEEYSRLAALSERLDHLRPPSGSAGIRLDRFSPNFNESARHGFANVRPLAPYRHIYRVPDAALHNLAYYFSYDYAKPQDTRTYVAPLLKSIRTWQRSHKTSELALARAGKQAVMIDLRRKARRPFKVLDPMDRAICEACDGITDARRIASALQEKGIPIESAALLRRLAALVDDAYLLRDGERYIGLAVPLGDYELPAHSVGRLVSAAQRLGRRTKGRITIPVEALDKRCTISKEPSVRVAKHVRPTFSIEKRGDLVVHLGAAER